MMDRYCNKMYAFRKLCLAQKFHTAESLWLSNPKRTLRFLYTQNFYFSYTANAKCCKNKTVRLGLQPPRAWIHNDGMRLQSEAERASGDNDIGEETIVVYGKKKPKLKKYYKCDSCGGHQGQWWGQCPNCKKPGALAEVIEPLDTPCWGGGAGTRVAEAKLASFNKETIQFEENRAQKKGWLHSTTSGKPESLSQVNRGHYAQHFRLPLPGNFGMEVARVLGGGVVIGSLVLVGGDPGVGKSTLLLQIGALLAGGCEHYGPEPVLYVSGEESVEQIGSRGGRMKIESDELYLYSSTDVSDILDKVKDLNPRAVIVDSIQTVYLKEASGSAGSISQVKECATTFLRYAKERRIPFFLVGHVNKSGDIAGPRVLEHIVDVVLYMEGERLLSHRILRAVKNRFGSIDEIGVLEMAESGLQPVANPSELYLGEREFEQEVLAGLAVTLIIDGSRPFLIETQALCCTGEKSSKRYNGVHESRADMIIAVLVKQAGLKLQDQAIFLNVVGGVKLNEPAGDLAIAASICSSIMEVPIPRGMAFIGEIGLAGELRMVSRMPMRISELVKLGFSKCFIPKSSMNSIAGYNLEGISIIGCNTVKEMIRSVFQNCSS